MGQKWKNVINTAKKGKTMNREGWQMRKNRVKIKKGFGWGSGQIRGS